MSIERRVKIFRNGRNLAVRIPREFEDEFEEGGDAVMHRENGRLVLTPVGESSLFEFLATLEPIDEEFPFIEDLPPIDDVEL